MLKMQNTISERRKVAPAESGAALLVALVVIVALSGLGVVALTASISASQASGNAALMSQSRLSTQPAVTASLRLLDDVNFASALTAGFRSSQEISQNGLTIQGGDPFPGAIFGTASGTLRGTVFGDPGEVSSPPPGDAQRDVNLRFRQQWPPVPVAGFEVGTFCRERVRVEGTVTVASRAAQRLSPVVTGTVSPDPPEPGPSGPDPDPPAPGVQGSDDSALVAAQSAQRFSMAAYSPPVACEGY